MTQKATSKPSKKQVDAVRTVLTGNHPDEYTRAWYVQRALSDVDDALHAAVAGEVVSDAPDGLTRHWLGSLGGSDRGASAHALAEAAAEIKGGRSFVTELLSPVASLIADEAVLMRAIKNLLIGRPFATLFLERGTALARVHAPETAPVLEARAAFAARHAELLADLRPDAQEKKQKLATAKLDTVKGDDRPLLITWLLSEPGIPTDAKRWARLAGFVDPAVEFEWLAYALNDGSGIYDEEEQQLGKLADAAGAPALERATNMLVFAIERTMVTAMEHLAEATPKAFGTERGFSAVETALLSNDARAKRICDDMRVISGVGKAFSNAQAERLVDVLLAGDFRKLQHELPRAMFYLYHPGAVPALARAFERDLTSEQRKAAIDCAAHAGSTEAYDLLISRMWVEQNNLRDLTFSLTENACKLRHDHILAELDRRPSIHAAWLAVGPQVHWNHRPRAVLDIAERVLAWPVLPDADPKKLASIFGHAVTSALELHRYDFARRAYDALAALPSQDAVDPCNDNGPVLKPADQPLIDKLLSGALAAELAALRDEVAAARSAGTPVRADDDRIGRLGGCRVKGRIHDDRATGEVWFFDAEGTFGYYDGYDIAPVDWWVVKTDGAGVWNRSTRLATFATGWRTEERTLCIAPGAWREITRSGDKLFGKVYRSDPSIAAHVFAMQLPSVERAKEVFASFAGTPMLGAKPQDPFYAEGKRDGGAIVRETDGVEKGYFWRLGREFHHVEYKYKSNPQMFATEADAIAAFDAHEDALLARGAMYWKLEVDGDRRPLTEMPLLQWIEGRARNDSETAAWHLAALPAIRDALALSQLSLDGIEAETLPPASETDLAAYDASLPSPMPDALREMWRVHAGASWNVGKLGERVLAPSEVLASRDHLRARFKDLVKKKQPKALGYWPFDHLDFLAVDREGNPTVAFDTRQQEESCYADCTIGGSGDWWDSLHWMMAVGPNHSYVKALKDKHANLKKVKYGEVVGGGKAAKPKAAKPAAKPAAKVKPAAKAKPAAKKKPGKAKK